ncbi:ABC transporter substrate-binding protein [Shewanella sp. VB17]|uniref:substrate-binding periplasmic protein n=1 Tax=Shewanella sp. VB17 TaxID=2739432 RepID=UPI0020B69C68|nr:transporter substrate-binding domain-containing protein [Shewanella sp. VB17]
MLVLTYDRMISRVKKCFLTLCLSCCSIPLICAPQTIDVVTESWIGYTNEDGSGFYFDILNIIFPEEDWTVNTKIVPFSRVRYLLNHDRADIALGFYDGDTTKALFSEQPVEVDSIDIALTPEMAEIWQGLGSLSFKKVQALLEYRYDEFIDFPMYYEESSSLLEMLDRVNRGKIDAVFDYKADMLVKAAQLTQPIQFIIKENVLRLKVFFAFSDNKKGKKIKIHFDMELQKMIDSGELDELFRKHMGADENRL